MQAHQQRRLRQKKHLEIQQWIQNGDWDEAYFQCEEALSQFGPSITLLTEKALCELHLGYFQEGEDTLKTLESEMTKSLELLSLETKMRAQEVLAKLYEACGDLEKAAESLRTLQSWSEDSEESQKRFWNLHRLMAIMGKIQDGPNLEHTGRSSFDFYRSQLWSGWRSGQWALAAVNFERTLELITNPEERALLARDFLEISLAENQASSSSCQKAIEILRAQRELPAYDDALLYLTLGLPLHSGLKDQEGVSKWMQIKILKLGKTNGFFLPNEINSLFA